jgi:hypothetical protein
VYDNVGLHWPNPGKPVLDLPSPNAAGDVVRLRDTRLLVIYNHSKERKALGRSTLLLSMSADGVHRPLQTNEIPKKKLYELYIFCNQTYTLA